MQNGNVKYSEIRLKVGLNESKVPVDIKWLAEDSTNSNFTDSKAFNLSIWDPVESNTLSINLWTEGTQTHEMHSFFFRALMQQADSYQRATGNPIVMKMMEEFVKDLAKKTAELEENRK